MVNFFSLYYDFWAAIFASALSRVLFVVIRSTIFQEEFTTGIVIESFVNMVWVFFGLSFVHIIITGAGYLYTEADILKQGNEQLLESFDEGLAIINQQDKKIIFLNESAKKLSL